MLDKAFAERILHDYKVELNNAGEKFFFSF